MGIFTGYCKKCDKSMSWFIVEGGGLKCKHCGEFNTMKDLWDSEFWYKNRDLKLLYDRVMKISKIKNKKKLFH